MKPHQHLQNLSLFDGYLQGYWLEETGHFFNGAGSGDTEEKMKGMMVKIFQARNQISKQEHVKKLDQIIIHGSEKLVIHQFMGRPGNRILLTSIVKAGTHLAKIKIKLYAIAESVL